MGGVNVRIARTALSAKSLWRALKSLEQIFRLLVAVLGGLGMNR